MRGRCCGARAEMSVTGPVSAVGVGSTVSGV